MYKLCLPANDRHEIAKSVQQYTLKFLDTVTFAVTYFARHYPMGSACGAVLDTSIIQSGTIAKFLMLIIYKGEESTPTQLSYILGLMAVMIVVNTKQRHKLAHYAEILRDQVRGNLVMASPIPADYKEKIMKGINTLGNLTANAVSVMNTVQILGAESKHVLSAAIALGPIAFVMQLLAVAEFYEIIELSDRWSKVAALLYALPDSILYANTTLIDISPTYLCVFSSIALLAIPGIQRQYFGGNRFDKTTRRDPKLLFISLEETVPLLDSPETQNGHLLQKIGLDKNLGRVLLQIFTVGLKTVGIHLSLRSVSALTIDSLRQHTNTPDWVVTGLDYLLMLLIIVFAYVVYFSNALVRNLLAEVGENIECISTKPLAHIQHIQNKTSKL